MTPIAAAPAPPRHDPAAYDGLARAYARHWGPRFHDAAAPVLEHLAYRHLPAGARVLDLCCGTGHLTARLVERGFSPVGVDGSRVMLMEARLRLPHVPFVCGDAAALGCAPVFDAVLSTFDSFNHILDRDLLDRVMRGAHRALRPGGLLVFDVNTEDAYRREWGKSSAVVRDDEVLIIQGGYDDATARAHTDVTWFRSECGAWQRQDTRVWQRPWSADEVVASVTGAAFHSTAICAAQDAGMIGDIATGRLFVTTHAA
jgi:SAM-dependent methyltransferase